MGVGLKVSCSCFGEFTMMVGPRMAPPRACFFPFLCTACRTVTVLDVYAGERRCDQCHADSMVPYGLPPALGEPGPSVIFGCEATDAFTQDALTLTDGTYWCPTCRKHTARFSDSGVLWD